MLKIKVKGIVTGNGTGCSPGRGRGSLGKDFLKRDVPPSSHKTVGGLAQPRTCADALAERTGPSSVTLRP